MEFDDEDEFSIGLVLRSGTRGLQKYAKSDPLFMGGFGGYPHEIGTDSCSKAEEASRLLRAKGFQFKWMDYCRAWE
jgi:hypothetical protein